MVHDYGFGDESRDREHSLHTFRDSGSRGDFRVPPSEVGAERRQLALRRDGSGNGTHESALEGVGRRKASQEHQTVVARRCHRLSHARARAREQVLDTLRHHQSEIQFPAVSSRPSPQWMPVPAVASS
jgi:hypothetical protein